MENLQNNESAIGLVSQTATIKMEEFNAILKSLANENLTGRLRVMSTVANSTESNYTVYNVPYGNLALSLAIAIQSKYSYINIMRVTSSNEEVELDTYIIEQLAGYGIVFENLPVDNKYLKTNPLAILQPFNDRKSFDNELDRFMSMYEAKPNDVREVYMDYTDLTYQEYLTVEKIVNSVNPNIKVIYHNQVSMQDYEMSIKDTRTDHLQLDGNSISIKDYEELLTNIDNAQTRLSRDKYMPELANLIMELMEDEREYILVDNYLTPTTVKLVATLSALTGKKVVTYGRSVGNAVVEEYIKFTSRKGMLVSDRVPSYYKEGIKIIKIDKQIYLYVINQLENLSVFTGVKLSEANSLLSKEPIPYVARQISSLYKSTPLTTHKLRFSSDNEMPTFKSIYDHFELEEEDDERYVYKLEIVNRMLFILESSIYKFSKMRTVRDMAIIEYNGEDYIGFFDFNMKYTGMLINLTGNLITSQAYIVEGEDVHNLIDIKTLTDYQQVKPMLLSFLNSITPEHTTVEMLEKAMETETDMSELPPYLLSRIYSKELGKELGMNRFFIDLYNLREWEAGDRFVKAMEPYASLRYLRSSGNKFHFNVFGHALLNSFNSGSAMFVNHKMFEMPATALETLAYLDAEVPED